MKLRGLIFGAALTMIFIGATSCFSQEESIKTAPPENIPELQWVWAEVVSVDPANNQLNIRYLDYETDTEKEMTVSIDDKTTYENVKSLSEIKPQDTVSIDYIVTSDGKNVARNINAEKSEGIESVPDESMKAPVKEEPKAQMGTPEKEASPEQGASPQQDNTPQEGQNTTSQTGY
ncbi:MAG: hypothetical protein ACM3IL_05105 [Deltaproteobacteria bacterium]